MGLTLAIVISIGVLCGAFALWTKRKKNRAEMDALRITPDALHRLIVSGEDVRVYDVRQPLDLLAVSEMISGAIRIPPRELKENPSLISKEKEAVVYCTCPSDKTSREVMERARALNFSRIKFLEGGLAAWKAKGYPVEEYRESFHLDTAK
jgi:rhodanese-related sulfurtransferase